MGGWALGIYELVIFLGCFGTFRYYRIVATDFVVMGGMESFLFLGYVVANIVGTFGLIVVDQ